MTLSLILGILIGCVLGLTGAGGGILAVPALITGMGWPLQLATPVALIAISSSAAVGTVDAFRKGLVRYRAAIVMALAGIPMTAIGEHIARQLSQRTLLIAFSAVMMLVSVRLFNSARARRGGTGDAAHIVRISPETGRFIWSPQAWVSLIGTGMLTGLMTGMLGVGGGFIIVPMLRRLTDLAMHGIVATSLMVIALVGSGAVVITLWHGTALPLQFIGFFVVSVTVGMLLGRTVSHRLKEKQVQMAFSLVLMCVSIGLLLKAAFLR